MSARTLRAVKILAALLMIPLLGAILVYFWINRIADQRWAEAEARIRRLSAAFPEGDSRREPGSDSAAAKENQIHFVAAIRGAAPTRQRKEEFWLILSERKTGAALDSALEEAQEFLDRLHQGARRIAASPSDFPPRWHGDWDMLTLLYMMHCGVLRARHQRELKQPFEAALTLLDLLQLAQFWAISGKSDNRGTALGNISEVVDELREVLSSEELLPDQFQRVSGELEPLDAALQSPLRDLEPWLARWGEYLIGADLNENGMVDRAPYRWRYLLPGRLMKAEAFEFADQQLQRLLAAESQGYPELLRLGRQMEEAADLSRNPIIRHTGNLLSGIGWSELARKAQFRLLRMAAHYRATGDVLKVDDPYGTVLRQELRSATVKFWSCGDDGKDDGGDMRDSGRWLQMMGASAPKDLVIEVPRRP